MLDYYLINNVGGLVEWAGIWGMEFNIKKCKILHVGRQNTEHEYRMCGQVLEKVEEERDIGVIVHKSLKPTRHCQKAAGTATGVLRQILKNFHYRDKRYFRQLYCQYVRPHLEFATPVWSPYTAADIEVLENVQKKAVRQIAGLRGKTYEERCEELGLESLVNRREQCDLVHVWKMLHSDNAEGENIFEYVSSDTVRTRFRSDPLNLKPKASRLDIRKHSFTVRVINKWNSLDNSIKSLPTQYQFKKAIKHLYRRHVGGAAAE